VKKIFFYFVAVIMLIAACKTADHTNFPDYIDTYVYGEPVDSPLPFSSGVNFSTWFEAPSARSIPVTRYAEQDFRDVKSIGVDVIRLPIHFFNMAGSAPGYTLDPLFLGFLDQAVDWAEKYEIYIILDNHSWDPVAPTDPEVDKILIPIWTQIAQRYKDRSGFVLYEIQNEPHHIEADLWGSIQGKVIDAIRATGDRHSIVVGGVWYNSIDELFNIPAYPDDNIIYTFHFYDPYLFTHQGETWGYPPNLKTLKGMPFPFDAHKIPSIPPDIRGTWIESSIRNAYKNDATVEALAKQLDKTVQFSKERGGVPLFCGEFGVFIPNSLREDRVRWYTAVTKLFAERGIARTSWDYFGGFGVFKNGKGGSFNSDLDIDIIRALGFLPPLQKPAEKIREAFAIYENYPSALTDFGHYGCDIDLYYQNGTQYAISYGNASLYGAFFFNFRREIDWDYFYANDYALTFSTKANKPAHFDVRFVNLEDDSTIPWRIVTPVDVEADGQWHKVRIPLSSMREQGAWISQKEQWRGPVGEFSWDKIVNLSFVAEAQALPGITILFDTIKLEP
jgi:endoglucanase